MNQVKKRKGKVVVSILLMALMVSTSVMSFGAQLYTDIPEDHWANAYITKVSELDIMPGYSDGTFKPDNKVSKLEVIVGIYNTIDAAGKLDGVDVTGMVNKHRATIESLSIPNELDPYGDVYPAVAFALENEIIVKDELKYFMKDGALYEASKLNTSVFIGKALNIYKKENLNKIISFDYKDAFDISAAAAPYVDLLIQYDIVDAKGDADGKFNPRQIVSRQNLTVMLTGFYDALMDETTGSGDTSTGTNTGSGTSGNDMNTGGTTGTDNSKDDAREAFEKKYDKVEGEYKNLSDSLTSKEGPYKVITVVDDNGKSQYYKVYESIHVEVDGQEIAIDDLEEGGRVTVYYDDVDAFGIFAYSKFEEFSAVLNKPTDFEEGSVLSIKDSDGKVIEQVIEEDMAIITNGNSVSKGDILKVTAEYGKITKVEATGTPSEDAGYIEEIIISNQPKLTIKDMDGKLKTYAMNPNYVVKDGDRVDNDKIYTLRLNQYVVLDMDAFGIKTVYLNKPIESKGMEAEIMEIHTSSNIMEVKDEDGKTWIITVKSGSSIYLSNYNVGDHVKIQGSGLSGNLFEAEKITMNN